MKQLKSCGVLCLHDHKALLLKHTNRYDLPKGHIETGETELECALRELKEETAIEADLISIDDEFEFELTYFPRYKRFGNKKVEKTVVIFLAYLNSEPNLVLGEHGAYEWVDLDFECSNNTVMSLFRDIRKHLKIQS